MEKSTALKVRVDPALKEQAEGILQRLGIPMSTAVNIFLSQVVLTGRIPFLAAPLKTSADMMTTDEIHAKLQRGLDDAENGRVRDARQSFEAFQETL